MEKEKLRKFNLDAAINMKRPVETVDGRKVTLAGYNHKAHQAVQVIGWIGEAVCHWDCSGFCVISADRGNDLVMAEEASETQTPEKQQEQNKLISFDIQRAIDGDKVVSRSGKKFTYGRYNALATHFNKIVGWLDDQPSSWNEYGISGQGWENDLFMAPKERTVWVNLYMEDGLNQGTGVHHSSEADAETYHIVARAAYQSIQRLGNKAHKITFEE